MEVKWHEPITLAGPQTALDLTHVLYNGESTTSLFLALFTLSPILLMASYAALAVQTRDYLYIVMWTGQLLCEGLNFILKHTIKQDRPLDSLGNGYGFPSSHSQYMGYFASFLVLHLFCRHKFASTGYFILDELFRLLVYTAIVGWSVLVAYSRYVLGYHTPYQIAWGYGIGVLFGSSLYLFAVQIPRKRPSSLLGRFKEYLLNNPVSVWIQIKDGWQIWPDGGREANWKRWRMERDVNRKQA